MCRHGLRLVYQLFNTLKQEWKIVLPHLGLEIISAIFFFSLKAAVHHNFQQVSAVQHLCW